MHNACSALTCFRSGQQCPDLYNNDISDPLYLDVAIIAMYLYILL